MPAIGDIIDGRYRILQSLGTGGYGTVYLAEELADDLALFGEVLSDGVVLRQVALKVFHPATLQRRRFAAEVSALCRLNHPSIVTVFHYGIDPVPYLAMEYVRGRTLGAIEAVEAAANWPRSMRQLIAIAEALAHAHRRGVAHRDMKPHNVLVDDSEHPHVVDFGLAWMVDPETDASRRIGTPGYLAPELIDGDTEQADHRADIYSMGATMFALFAGASPFAASSALGTLRRQQELDIDWPPDFPMVLQPLILRCVAVDPAQRPQSAMELADELRRILWNRGRIWVEGDVSELVELPVDCPPIDVIDARVGVGERFDHRSRGPGIRLTMRADAEHADSEIRAFAYLDDPVHRRRLAARDLALAWEGAELSLFGAELVRDSRGGSFLTVGDSTVPVIEPHLLVPVTAVASAAGVRAGACPSRVLVDQREQSPRSHHLVAGALAHDMLELVVRRSDHAFTEADYHSAFDEAFVRLRIDAVAADMDDEAVEELRAKIHNHFTNLVRWAQRNASDGSFAEVRRLSTRYGLEGRIDLAVQDHKRLRIVELKTGRYRSPEHVDQLRAYSLMWDGYARSQDLAVDGMLVYSSDGAIKPLRRGSHATERAVLLARNRIVAMQRWFSDGFAAGRPPSFGELPELCDDGPCRFRRDRCRSQCETLGSNGGPSAAGTDTLEVSDNGAEQSDMIARKRAWYFHFATLIEREYRAVSRRIGDLFRPEALASRVERVRAIADSSIAAVDEDRIEFACANPGVFSVGDSVLAHRMVHNDEVPTEPAEAAVAVAADSGAGRSDADDEPVLTGRVVVAGSDHVVIRCASADYARSLARTHWALDHDLRRVGFRDARRAIYRLIAPGCEAQADRLLAIRGSARSIPTGQQPMPQVSTAAATGSLNDEQALAVHSGVHATEPVLIQGPPGTGKTTVVAEIVSQLAAAGARVLVAAGTHAAVDNVLTRILDLPGLLRVGNAYRASGELRSAASRAGVPLESLFSDSFAEKTPSLAAIRERISEARVVAATTNACVSSPVFEIIQRASGDGAHRDDGSIPAFDVAVIDEAAQITEPMTVAAIVRARRFILIGDERQLPPVVSANDARTEEVESELSPTLRALGVGGLDRSLFERLRRVYRPLLLTRQYRMSTAIQSFPSRSFYGGALVADPSAADRSLVVDPERYAELGPEMARRLNPEKHSVWVDVGSEAAGMNNPTEAVAAARTAAAILRTRPGNSAADITRVGIVSPFRAQCRLIREALVAELGDEAAMVEVDTVEKFQGREKEAILVSLVTRRWSEFVFDARRLNVTLTRARSKVIVFGPQELGRRMVETWIGA